MIVPVWLLFVVVSVGVIIWAHLTSRPATGYFQIPDPKPIVVTLIVGCMWIGYGVARFLDWWSS